LALAGLIYGRAKMTTAGSPDPPAAWMDASYTSIGCELGLINLVEEHDALVGHVLLQSLDRFRHGIRTLGAHDAIILGCTSC